MKALKTALIILLMASHHVACAEEASRTAVYDVGLASLTFAYPASYVLDPKSNRDAARWWARLTSPKGDLAMEAMSLGYCSEYLHDVEGFKSPEDYVLKEVCGAKPERTRFDGYDRLISRTSSSITVVFLRHKANWGKCFQKLTFLFAEGAYPGLADTIDQVINSALPSFDARRWDNL